MLSLNTYLGADASPSDTLVVDGGAATGATALRITNQAGPGAKTTGDGIQVVQAINGGTTAPGAFTSGGIYAGAYSYMLFRGGVTPGYTLRHLDRQGNQDLLTGAGRLPAAGRAPGAIISRSVATAR